MPSASWAAMGCVSSSLIDPRTARSADVRVLADSDFPSRAASAPGSRETLHVPCPVVVPTHVKQERSTGSCPWNVP
jgi:hypothetical protein